MIRGEYEYRIGDGPWQIAPNQFTIVGMQKILKSAFWQEIPLLYMGLCNHNPGSMIGLASVQEPSATNGYARQSVPMNQVNWPIISSINGESYIESREVIFDLSGALSIPIGRFFLTDGVDVFSISSELQGGVQVYDEPITNRYRLFFW